MRVMTLYAIRNKETHKQHFAEGLFDDKTSCLRFLENTPDRDKYELVSREVSVGLKPDGDDLYMQTEYGPIVIEEME